MFGFGKKKPPAPPPREKRQRTSDKTKEDYKNDLEKLGLLGIVGDDDFGSDGVGTDSEPDERDLEDELMSILGQDAGSTDALVPPVKSRSAVEIPTPSNTSLGPAPPADADLEPFFQAPPPPATVAEALEQRLVKYKVELEKATEGNEGASKVRRMGRIVKQYEDAIKDHKRGRLVAFEELPTPPGFAPIPTGIPATTVVSPPPHVEPSITSSSTIPQQKLYAEDSSPDENLTATVNQDIPETKPTVNEKQLQALIERQKQFKTAALDAKQRGDMGQAKEFLRTTMGFDKLIQAAEAGLPVDLATLPSLSDHVTSIPLGRSDNAGIALSESMATLGDDFGSMDATVSLANSGNTAEIPTSLPPAPSAEADFESLFQGPPPPGTIREALDQRLAKYNAELEKATTGNEGASKVRRMGRIVKQYEDAIKDYTRGRPVAFEELPTPPGYAPIPTGIPAPAASVISPSTPSSTGISPQPKPSSEGSSPGQAHGSTINRGVNKPQTKLTLQEKQLHAITERQKQFKEAALNAKQRGDIGQAKEFLRTAIGFDKLIQASEAGLPVDMATLPSPPDAVASFSLETSDDFDLVNSSDCVPPPTGSKGEIFDKLEEDLREQLKMCMRTRDHFKSMGDVASANRFEKLAIETKKDLDALRLSMKQNGELPKFHFETRTFSITDCNSDLADDEIEINIIKGINYKVPNPTGVDTFIKVDLPYPSAEEAQTNKTAVIRDTNNPDYEATFKMKINRTARPFQRFIHRHGVKLELWSKGGFLRSSTLIGTATVKLLPLETKCTLHDGFDILEGRKVVGKIEVKVRIREPILTKQITQKKEKWLTIDRV